MNSEIFDYLDELFPNPKCELNYTKDYELLIATMLSAQTTDKRVNKVTEVLFKKYPTLKDLAEAPVTDIEKIIKELGTYKRKSVYVHEIAKKLVDDGYDYAPNDRFYIESLPGVGHKTTNVFLANIYNEPTLAVDTHVTRVSKRLGLAKKDDDVLTIEKKLEKKIPKERWSKTHHQLVLYGRYYCKAVKPECDNCKIKHLCKEKNRTNHN